MILRILLALRKPIATLLGAIGLYAKGRADAKAAAKLEAATADIEAHERMTDADLGIGASDVERVRKLNDLADRLGG